VDQPRRQHTAQPSGCWKQAADLPATPESGQRKRSRNEFIFKKKPTKSKLLGPRGRRPSGRRTSSAAGVEEQEGLRAEHLLLGGAADVRVAEVVPLVGARFGVEVAVAHIGGVVPA
jgi:hypothetical protein